MQIRAWLVVVGLLPLTFASCVFSVHPLSDDTNSFLDKKLIGYWEVKGSNPKGRILIGRKPDTKNTLALVTLPTLTDESFVIESEAITVNIRKGKTGNYLSLLGRDKPNEKNEKIYQICKYDMPDKNKFRVFSPNETFFEAAVKRGELKGETASVKPQWGKNEPKDAGAVELPKRTVVLSDTPDRIFNFLEKHGAKCFDKEPAVYLRYRATD